MGIGCEESHESYVDEEEIEQIGFGDCCFGGSAGR